MIRRYAHQIYRTQATGSIDRWGVSVCDRRGRGGKKTGKELLGARVGQSFVKESSVCVRVFDDEKEKKKDEERVAASDLSFALNFLFIVVDDDVRFCDDRRAKKVCIFLLKVKMDIVKFYQI